MWVYLLVGICLGYALYKERQALGCGNFFEGKDCDNANGKAVKGTDPSVSDSTPEILDKIEFAANYQSRFVKWRAYLIVSFLATIFLWFIVFKRFPYEWELVVSMIILFATMKSFDGFYRFHLCSHIKSNIDKSVKILRQRYKML